MSPLCAQRNDSPHCSRLGGGGLLVIAAVKVSPPPPPSLMTLEMKLEVTELPIRTSYHRGASRLVFFFSFFLRTPAAAIKHKARQVWRVAEVLSHWHRLKLDGCLLQ